MLIELLKKMTTSNLLLLTIENIEQIILLVGLELLRSSLNMHFRGLALGCAPGLDHICNLVRLTLGDDYTESYGTTIIKHSLVTAWNDINTDKPDYERSHMIHLNMHMTCGWGFNINTKKAWNGVDLEGLKVSDKETKKHLRVIKYNDFKTATFEAPHFNREEGTYDFRLVGFSFYEDIENPLIPAKTQIFIIIEFIICSLGSYGKFPTF